MQLENKVAPTSGGPEGREHKKSQSIRPREG